MNDEIIKLFSQLQKRNSLAKDRSRKRARFARKRAKLDGQPPKEDSVGESYIKSMNDYAKSCAKLARFTSKNSKFRTYIRKKYSTRQINDGSNHVVGISLVFNGEKRRFFSIEDIERYLQEHEIEQILLGTKL